MSDKTIGELDLVQHGTELEAIATGVVGWVPNEEVRLNVGVADVDGVIRPQAAPIARAANGTARAKVTPRQHWLPGTHALVVASISDKGKDDVVRTAAFLLTPDGPVRCRP